MEDNQIDIVETYAFDKLMKAYLVMLSAVSLYNLYATTMFGQYRIPKVLMGLVMIVSEIILIILALKSYRVYGREHGGFLKLIIWIVLLYNMTHIAYAATWDDKVVYLSLFGNPIYQPAFMLPFVLIVGMNITGIRHLYKAILYYTLIAIPMFFFTGQMSVFLGMGLLFLLAFLRYFPRGWRIFLLLFVVAYIIYSYYDDARIPIIRVLMGLAIFVFSLTSLHKSILIKTFVLVVAIAMPIYYLALFVKTGYSVFEESTTTERVSRMGVDDTGDTRTFLYEEVFDDLTESKAWLLGKGINGTYYSSYFDQKRVNADAADRILVEVGFLDYLLKGGLVQTILYMLLLLLAIFNCYYRSSSKSMVLIGAILLAHYVLLFVEDVPRYDLYNFAMWFCIGMSFSPTLLEQDDDFFLEQIDLIFSKA